MCVKSRVRGNDFNLKKKKNFQKACLFKFVPNILNFVLTDRANQSS